MTVILVLLCAVVAGGELYLAFDRRRSGSGPEIIELRRRLTGVQDELARLRTAHEKKLGALADGQALHAGSIEDAGARIRSLVEQINDRMLPEVNQRLRQEKETAELLAAEVADLRGHVIARLDQAVAASLGAEPVDTVAGALAADLAEPRPGLVRAYERFAERYGLRVEMTDPAEGDDGSWRARLYLSGRSPRALERDFFDLLQVLRTATENEGQRCEETAHELLDSLKSAGMGGAQLGPLVIVRTPEALLCGVLSLAELRQEEGTRLLDDPLDTAVRLHRLPEGRFCDLSGWPALNG